MTRVDGDTAASDRERQFDSLLSNLGGVVYRCRNGADWTVTWISDGCRTLLGYSPADLVGNRTVSLRALIHPDDALPLLEKCQRDLAVRQPCSNEYRIRTASGEEKWVWDQAHGVHSESGELLFIDGLLTDITERKRADARFAAAEAALRGSERRFRALLERSTDAIAVFTADGQAVYQSPAAEQITGYTHAELMAGGAAAFTHPDDVATVGATFAELAATPGATRDTVFRLLHKSGRTVWIEARAQNLLDDPDVGGIVCNYRDVTERELAARALRESEERLRLALAGTSQGIYDLDLTTGEALVTPEYATMLGYDPVTFRETDAGWRARMHPDERDAVTRVYEDYLAGRRPDYRVEFRQRTPSGEWRWILSLGKIVQRAPDGRPLRMLGSHTDITDRKLTEERLRRSEEYRRAIFDAEPECVKVVSHDGVLLDMNPAGLRLLEVASLAEATCKPLLEFVVPEHRAAFVALHRRVLQGESGKLEFEIVGVNGTRRWMATHAVPLRDSAGEVHALLGISHDITGRREAEAERGRLQSQLLQAQKMDSIGRLAGGVAHDFNNMLSVILSRAEMAIDRLDGPRNEPLHEDLQEISKAARRSADLTRQLLAFSRRQPVAPRVIDLDAAIAEMLLMLRRLIGEQIELDWRPGPGSWRVNIDPTQLHQVLVNLVINARDAIAQTGIVTIATTNVPSSGGEARGDCVCLTVGDNGAGMSTEVQAHLFEPFFTTKGVGLGTGLGLATVWGIVRQNAGTIEVESEAGRGSTFRILLPRAPGPLAGGRHTADRQALRSGGETVLLVEDERAILDLERTMLGGLGYHVLAANSPTEALRLAAAHDGRIDLLITDVVMPGMSGMELQKRLQADMPHLKCLFVSGYPAELVTEGGVLRPGLRFLQKPFDRADLAASIHETIADQA